MTHVITKSLTLLAGPNGAGKTTFAKKNFPELIEKGLFLNADHFAAEINADDVSKVAITVGKRFINELESRLNDDDSLIIESTISGLTLLRKLEAAKAKGFLVRLIFLWLDEARLCDFRVKSRVILGGHNIPEDDIKRRFARGLMNLSAYTSAADEFEIFLANETPQLIISKSHNKEPKIHDPILYAKLQDMTTTIRLLAA